MPTIHFLGIVLPKGVNLTVGHDPVIQWEAPEHDLSMKFHVQIVDSIIDVECEVNRFSVQDVTEIRMRALDICRASVNLIAFATGHGLSVILDTLVDPLGNKAIVSVHNPGLAEICNVYRPDVGFDEIHSMVLQDVRTMLILNDLISGLTNTHTAAISCARTVDGIKHAISTENSSDQAAWRQMQVALNADKSYLKFITDRSIAPRHGQLVGIAEADVQELLKRSWKVMDRYLMYLKRGRTPLPVDDFPMLSG